MNRPRRPLPALAGPCVLLIVAAALVSLTAGCKSGLGEDPILRLSAAEALTEGKTLMADEKYARARRYLSHAFEVEPNSLSGREALLLLADSYHLDGGAVNFVQAEAKYRDFLNRFPTSDQAAYAQFQVANSLAGRMEKPDRDQSATESALAAYQELIRLYPTSEYVAKARAKIGEVRERLAEHEYVVGQFYLRRRLAVAAIDRFEDMLDAYPDYPEPDKVLCSLALAYSTSRNPAHAGKAAEVVERLRREHPESSCAGELPAAVLDGASGGGE
jgi:outer membrane protein assembly factor BamD